MKHIKSYENTNYKGDDYVIIKQQDSKRLKYFGDNWNIYPYHCAKIVHHNDDAYYIESFDVKNNKEICLWINIIDIERKATTEEIDDYKINKEANKFNL